jgi:pilus assembly protein CpaC
MDRGVRDLARKQIVCLAILLDLLLSGEIVRGQVLPPSIQVTVNQSVVLRLAQKAKRVSVTQPLIAEVVVVTPTQLLINGKAIGTTSFVIWDEKGETTKIDLVVTPNVASLRRQFEALFPLEKIEVSSSGPFIVLKGEVSNEVVYDKVLEITQSYLPPAPAGEIAPPSGNQTVTVRTSDVRLPTTGTAFAGGGQLAFTEEAALTDVGRWGSKRRIPGIIDLLVIKEFRQIQVSVVVAEISLSKIRELGLDYTVLGKSIDFLSLAGSQGGFSAGQLFSDPSTFPPTVTFGGATSAILRHVSDDVQIASLYRLFQNRDIAEILAQPTLVIKNGRSGGFLAGGEFPVTIATADTINIQFKPFGVRLDFLPTITWSNTIDLRIFPEVSEIDPSVSTVISGVSVPGLRVRRSVSRVEMKEGETLIMSGLLDRRVIKSMTKFPILGDIPYLGTLFRSTRFRDQETELIFLVTPRVVKALEPGEKPKIPSLEKYDTPDMRQIPLPDPPPRSDRKGPTIP